MGALKTKIENVKKEYYQAKEDIAALDRRVAEHERAYLLENGVKNSDGSTPQCLEDIEDDDTFNAVNQAFPEEMAAFYEEYGRAEKALISAERELSRYALSLAPESVRPTLEESAEHNAATMEKLAELILRLDVSTIAC